jgi:hypothetical protein
MGLGIFPLIRVSFAPFASLAVDRLWSAFLGIA